MRLNFRSLTLPAPIRQFPVPESDVELCQLHDV